MKVMKFGGGCLKDARHISKVVRIVLSEQEGLAVVTSALYGVTDKLLHGIEAARLEEGSIPSHTGRIAKIHTSFVSRCVKDATLRSSLCHTIHEKIQRLEKLYYAVSYTDEITDSVRGTILSYGERLAAVVLAGALRDGGCEAVALESQEIGLVTDDTPRNATVQLEVSGNNARAVLTPLINRGVVPVITGFFGCTPGGKTSLFGRNGSDYSAAVLARITRADTFVLWKDVDGFMSADPKMVPAAYRLDSLSYYEAAELSYFGAKILHPRTIEPLTGTGIAINVRNLHATDDAGTAILAAGRETSAVIKSVTYNSEIAVLRIKGSGVGYKPGIIAGIGHTLSQIGINIYSILTSQTCINLLIDKRDAERGVTALRAIQNGVIERIDVREDVALIAVVGEGILKRKGVAAMVFSAVSEAEVNVEMISTGASGVASYFVVGEGDLSRTVGAIHRKLLE